ncbi:cytochrome C [Opitutaceae bacterium EW11]|nr:cytochrome C [Opitutaceae bacterium EW11]
MSGASQDPAGSALPPRRSIWRNWVTLAGTVVAVGSFFAFLLLFAIDTFGPGQHNPYLGILSYLVAPGFLILGLVLVFGGAWWQRRQQHLYPERPAPTLSIDLSQPKQRWRLFWFGLGTVTFLLCTALGSYQTYHYTESVQFCGQVCHTVMEPEFVTYQRGNHARVACVECHIGSGATWYVKSKLSGAYQVYSTAFNKYHRPIGAPVENLRPAQDTCERCHWPEKFAGSLDRVYNRFLTDEKTTPYTVRLLLHVGGGASAHGPVGGIHWHMNVANKVEYLATDTQRQKIPWVRVTSREGKVTVYRTPDYKGEPDPKAVRRMDCIDCHNRPAHAYRSPDDAVDEALYLGRIDRSLTSVKYNVVELLTKPYNSVEEASAGITNGLRKKYGADAKIDGTIAEAISIYQHNFFPKMKADWSSYPNNQGHKDSAGCFRCHDNNHIAEGSKEKIAAGDCNTCHTILTQGEGAELMKLSADGQTFKHPGGSYSDDLICSDCHNGKLQEP